jgi:hypothetical protein
MALDMTKSGAASRIEPRSPGSPVGNLLFCDGVLWAQGPETLIAFTPLQNRLSAVEARLAHAPEEGTTLAERGGLRLETGNLAGAIADLRQALASSLPAKAQDAARRRLFGALTELLQRDFPEGEKYLPEWRTLSTLVPGKGNRPPTTDEVRQRRQQLCTLVAAGRGRQGRVSEALQSWREFLALSQQTDLLSVPEEPGLRVRPEVWARECVAGMARAADAEGRRTLAEEMDRAWQEVRNNEDQVAAVRRFLTLFGSVPTFPGTAVVGPEARLLLARQLAEMADPRRGLEADFLFAALAEDRSSLTRPIAARALELRARLLVRRGLLDEAAAINHRLGTDFANAALERGTGAEALVHAQLDKRLIPYLDALEHPPRPAWVPGHIKAVERPADPAWDQLVLPCVPRQPFPPACPGTLGATEGLPVGARHRFLLDGRTLTLVTADRDFGRRLWAVPLPLQSLPPQVRNGELPTQVVDHLLLVPVGSKLFAVDLLERRVRWVYDCLEDVSPAPVLAGMLSDGSFQTTSPDGQTVRRFGWVGPASREGVCVLEAAGLVCLDPANGTPRWIRSDVPQWLSVFGDREYLFLGDHHPNGSPRGLKAVRLADGRAVPIPDASAAYAKRVRILGRKVLVGDEGPSGEVSLRLYDVLSGKDDWVRTFPTDSVVLKSPSAELLGVAAPDGAVTVVDLATGREGPRLTLESAHWRGARVTGGSLFRDAEQIYVGLLGQGDGSMSLMDGPNPYFRCGLPSIPVNGMLYAFDRATGKRRWYSQAPGLTVLLERFDELPVLICAAASTRQTEIPGNAEGVVALRSFDKRTGKILFHREFRTFGEAFHTLRLDPRAGTVDLVGGTLVLRHQPAPGR